MDTLEEVYKTANKFIDFLTDHKYFMTFTKLINYKSIKNYVVDRALIYGDGYEEDLVDAVIRREPFVGAKAAESKLEYISFKWKSFCGYNKEEKGYNSIW